MKNIIVILLYWVQMNLSSQVIRYQQLHTVSTRQFAFIMSKNLRQKVSNAMYIK